MMHHAVVSWQLMALGDKVGDVALGQSYQQLVSHDLSYILFLSVAEEDIYVVDSDVSMVAW